MKRIICILFFIVLFPVLLACSKDNPTEEQIFKTIKNDTIIAKNDFLELRTVTVKSSSWMDNKYRALLQVDFINHKDTMVWNNRGQKDFIPFGTELVEGVNTVEVSAIFSISYAGDGSWYLESFTF
ncbi:uncharacterized protein Dvar_64660 [Desulfosarcina variabilis str. Montpellier]|uniref:hypothetical protein n=1 Tax=Desulfosarcina variabilis TaxID=2300 RepID=UPI003AFB5846